MQTSVFKLENSLRVILVDTKAFPSLTCLLLFGAGSRYENKKNNGISHFLEHMFYKGSKKYPDPFILSTAIESLGGVWNAFTSKNYTGYYIKAASDHFNTIVDILSDILLRPKFEEMEIAKEKGVIIEEMNMYEDQPQMKVGEIYENLLYRGSALGFNVIGTKKVVMGLNQQDFFDYRKSLYHPNNAVLVVAGGLNLKGSLAQFSSHESLPASDAVPLESEKIATNSLLSRSYLNIIKEKFGGWEKGKPAGFETVKEKQVKPEQIVRYKETEQAHFCFGYRTFGINDERKYILNVLATIMGGGASSRLFAEVRERRGLCYYIHTMREHFQEVGYLMTQAGVAKEVDKIKEAVRAVVKEHEKVVKDGVTKEEIIKAKEMIKGRIILSMEDSFNVANYYGMKQLFEGLMVSPEAVISKIEKVTQADVVEMAATIFQPGRANFSLIGPIKESQINIEEFFN